MDDLSAQAQEKEIDGVTYKSWPISFSKGRPALMRLLGILSPVLSSMVGAKSKADTAAALFGALPASLSDADLAYFAKLYGDAAQYKGEDGNWVPLIEKSQPAHFEGRYLAYFQWLAFCSEVNFAGFFTGMGRVAKSDAPAATETST